MAMTSAPMRCASRAHRAPQASLPRAQTITTDFALFSLVAQGDFSNVRRAITLDYL